jgi:hypothetical protein
MNNEDQKPRTSGRGAVTPYEIQKEAWEAFERWCREYDPDGNMDFLDLAEAYDKFAVSFPRSERKSR